MQLIESALALCVLIQLIFLFIPKKEKQIFAFIGLGLLAFHFILGEGRWQMAFIYLIEVILIMIFLKGIKAKKWPRILGTFFSVLALAISIILTNALPIFTLPETSGSYNVGLSKLYLKVEDRSEITTEDPTDKRELMVNVWYPTESNITGNEQYLPDVEREGFAMKYGLPSKAFNYLDNISTQHQLDAEPANGEFPVLVFSPGYYTPASGYLTMIEELVSHGFVIFNLITPHETMGLEYPDGRKVFFNQTFNESNSWNWNNEVAKAVETLQNASNESVAREATQRIVNSYGGDIVKRWALDITNLIDELPRLNSDTSFPLTGQLNLDQLATYGHSIGGAAAVEAAIFDERIKAAINLDGSQWGSLMNNPLNKPGALISSNATDDRPDPNQYIFQASIGPDFHNLVLDKTGHSNFSDIPFMINVSQLNEAGSLDPELAVKSTNQFLISFFSKYLLGLEIDLRDKIESDSNLNYR